ASATSRRSTPGSRASHAEHTAGPPADHNQPPDAWAAARAGPPLRRSLPTDTVAPRLGRGAAHRPPRRRTPAAARHRDAPTGDPRTKDTACDEGANGLAVTWEEQVINPHAETRTLRLRKDGTIRSGSHVGASPFRPAKLVDGKPARRVDYRV